MNDKNITPFENKHIRTTWDEEKQEWYFSIVDICTVLTDSNYQTARNYWKCLKTKLKNEGSELLVILTS
jgi:prophage antirepressor-like protein